jgi:hypothetical protein
MSKSGIVSKLGVAKMDWIWVKGASPDSFFPLFQTCSGRINRRGNRKVVL